MVSWWGLKTGMYFWGQVWKRVWEIAFFGLKLGLDLEMRAAHPTKNSEDYPPSVCIQISRETNNKTEKNLG